MKKYKISLTVSMLIWGSIGIFVRYINFTSSQIATARAIIGSLFLICFSILSKENLSKEKIKSNLLLLISCGICLAFNWIFLFQAYNYTTISISTICYYLAPIIVIFLSQFILKEKLTLIKVLCMIISLMGMFCVVGIDKTSINKDTIIGILYALGAACFYAGVVILNKFLKDISGRESSVIQLSVAAMFLLPYTILTDKISLIEIDTKSIFLLLVLGIVHTGIAYLIYFTSIPNLPSQTVAIYSYIDPISAIIMSSIILNENMKFIQVFGAVLILGSTFINEIYNKNTNLSQIEIIEE